MPKDYYVILGVNRGADQKKIQQAYRSFVKKFHPDATGTQETADRFREIKEAYETLGDEEKRKEYDRELARQGSTLRISRVPDIIERRTSSFAPMDSFFSSVDEFFAGLLPGFFDRGLPRGKSLYLELILTPREAAEGGLFPVTVPVIEECPKCSRAGFWEGFFCPICAGYGRVHSQRRFSLSVPAGVSHGTEITLSMEEIGFRRVDLHITVLIDRSAMDI
ncbi:MAG: J domain-containing protein [Deltaproteobacteria bacterium]|nr:J domain-containing protein [Deltaproteobacteria bacterium]MBW2069863.1 J domain-containing protein [Deltaproteobacteria bacterium]